MPIKKQRSACELIESFKNNTYKHLSREDRLFCEKCISREMNEQQIYYLTLDYIHEQGNKRNLELLEADKLARDIANYITVYRGLLLSYSPPKGMLQNIPEKYYRAAPRSLGMALITIPSHNIIITTSVTPGEAWYGSQRHRAGMMLFMEINLYNGKWIIVHRGNFIDTHYPRFSLDCKIVEDCPAYVESCIVYDDGDGISDLFSTECKMSPNRSHLCLFEKFAMDTYRLGLTGFHAIVQMCYERWEKRPMRSDTKIQKSYSDRGVSYVMADSPQWEHVSGGFREVQLRDYPIYIQQTKAKGFHVENRISPCEHERRGHIRTLSDGRKINVRPSIVNKGGEKIVYKVNG